MGHVNSAGSAGEDNVATLVVLEKRVGCGDFRAIGSNAGSLVVPHFRT
jgi:hypothetical protein